MRELALFTLLVGLAVCASAQTVPATTFGASFRLKADWPAVDGASNSAQVYSTRIWDAWTTYTPTQTGGMKWADLQGSNTTPTWTDLDYKIVTQFLGSPPQGSLVITYTFGDTPLWATACNGQPDPGTCFPGPTGSGYGGGTQCKDQDAGCLPPSDINTDGTGNDAYFASFAAALIARYAGEINYYEIRNEADSDNYWCQVGGTVPCGGGNSSTTANTPSLQRLIRTAWDLKNIAHCLDPNAKILSPSVNTGKASTWFHYYNVSSISAPAGVAGVNGVPAGCNWSAQSVTGAQTYDYVNIHGRGDSTVPPSTTGNWDPDSITVAYSQIVAEIAADSLPNPSVIFNDEYGYENTDVTNIGSNLAAYEAYVSRGLIWCASLGLTQCDWYQWDSQFSYGLQSTAIGTAYDITVGWLAGATVGQCVETGTVYQCPVTKSGTTQMIAWDTSKTCNPTCTYGNYTFGSAYVSYVDLTGTSHNVGTNGTVSLGWQPILLTRAAIASPTRLFAIISSMHAKGKHEAELGY